MTDPLSTQYSVLSTPKACCAAAYESDWARLLLGDSFHPGGLALTERLGRLLGLGPADRVLDVACGPGTSALHLAATFGCRVVGVDLGVANLARATAEAERRGLAALATFEPGDAERLPFPAASFDAVLCECSFCLFPTKPVAAAEFARVLCPGGRLGLADVALEPTDLPEPLRGLLARVACLADARPVATYQALLEAAGLTVEHAEDHAAALLALVDTVRTRLLAAQVAAALGRLDLGAADLAQGRALIQAARDAVGAGQATYALLVARPSGARRDADSTSERTGREG